MCSCTKNIYFIGRIYSGNNELDYRIYRMNKENYKIREISNFTNNETISIEKMAGSGNDLFLY